MKSAIYSIPLILFLALFTTSAFSQKITQVKSELKENKVIITYNLSGPEKQKFLVSLYTSKNNGETYDIEVTSATGEIGYGIKPGKKKQIIWDPTQEGISDMQNIKFSIQAMASGLGKKKK